VCRAIEESSSRDDRCGVVRVTFPYSKSAVCGVCDPFECCLEGEHMHAKSAFLAIAGLAAAAAQADESAVVITATRTELPLSEVGQSISVIDADAIARRQSDTVVDLLRTLPGITITTTPTRYTPFRQMQIARFDGATWVPEGPLISVNEP